MTNTLALIRSYDPNDLTHQAERGGGGSSREAERAEGLGADYVSWAMRATLGHLGQK
jgi:hypothetical protein